MYSVSYIDICTCVLFDIVMTSLERRQPSKNPERTQLRLRFHDVQGVITEQASGLKSDKPGSLRYRFHGLPQRVHLFQPAEQLVPNWNP